MKILMLGWELPPHNSGGLGVACYYLCKALSSKGVDINFILPYSAEHNIEFMNINGVSSVSPQEFFNGNSVYDFSKYVLGGNISGVNVHGGDIWNQAQIYEDAVAEVSESMEFDIIHAHDWFTFRAALRAKQGTNKPLILHVHSIEPDRSGGGYGNPFVREIESTAMLLADKTIAVSQHTKDTIISEYGIPEDKIEVVHNSIDPESITPLDDNNVYRYLETLKAQGYKVISNVGRLTIQKGLYNLLRAAKLVIEREPRTIFMLVGSGDQERELLEQAAELGISRNVIFTGFQRGKNWRDAYSVSDLFVMPSVSEPFGLVALEAIGYGTPALVSKQSGVAEVIKSCLKVDFWDVDELANQITSLVRSDALRDELHKNSLSEYNQLSWSTTADSLINLYNRHRRVYV